MLSFSSSPPGSFGAGVTTTPLSVPVAYAAALGKLDGVRATTPVGRYVRSGAGGIGFELVEGIEFEPTDAHESYLEITGMRVVEGRAPDGDREIVIDRQRAADGGANIGSTIELFGRDFTVVGIFEPEIGARMKLSPRFDAGAAGHRGEVFFGAHQDFFARCARSRRGARRREFSWQSDHLHPRHPLLLCEGHTQPDRLPGRRAGDWATAISGLVVLLAMYNRGIRPNSRDRDTQIVGRVAPLHRDHHREGSTHHQRTWNRGGSHTFPRGGGAHFPIPRRW